MISDNIKPSRQKETISDTNATGANSDTNATNNASSPMRSPSTSQPVLPQAADTAASTGTKPWLVLSHVHKQYSNAVSPVLQDVSLEIGQGEFCCILGKSGCGKSTLLRCIAGFEPFTGQISLEGKVQSKPNPDSIMVFQDFNQLFAWKTVRQNMLCAIKYNDRVTNKEESVALGYQLLKMVGLESYLDYYPHQLSGGMKQRAAIARALALRPKIMLMDEPFASLDAITRKHLQQELISLTAQTGTTVLFVTHNIQEALTLGDRLLVLAQGGQVVFNEPNSLPRPVKPSTPGFSEVWNQLSAMLDQ